MTITNEINTLRHYYVVFGRLKVQSYNYSIHVQELAVSTCLKLLAVLACWLAYNHLISKAK